MSPTTTPGASARSSVARSGVIGRREPGADAERVTGEHRHPHAGRRDRQVGQSQDLPALVAELLLLVGLTGAVVDDRPGHGKHVEGDGAGEVVGRSRCRRRPRRGPGPAIVATGLAHLRLELVGTGQAGTGHRLVGADHQRFEPGFAVERLQHRHGDHGGAVGVGHDALGDVLERLGVDLGHHQRDVGVHPPGRRVVDDGGAGRGDPFGDGQRRGLPRREEGDVDARTSRRWRHPRRRPSGPARSAPDRRIVARRTPGARRAGKDRSASICNMTPPT